MQYYNAPDDRKFTKETRYALKLAIGTVVMAVVVFALGTFFGLYAHHVRCACNHNKRVYENLKSH